MTTDTQVQERPASQLPPSMKMKAPCTNCPYRKDQDFLRVDRKIEITYQLGWLGRSFNCHKTLDYSSGEGGRFVSDCSNHCAGAMIYLHKIGRPNAVMQIGERLGMWSVSDLRGSDLVHDTIAGFIGDDRFQTIEDVRRHVEG